MPRNMIRLEQHILLTIIELLGERRSTILEYSELRFGIPSAIIVDFGMKDEVISILFRYLA